MQKRLSPVEKNQMGKIRSRKKKTEVKITAPAPEIKAQPSAPINKEFKKELQKQQRIFQQLEEKIAGLKTEQQKLEAALSDPAVYSDKTKFLEAETAYKKASAELVSLNSDYEKAFEKIVELEEKAAG
jgi:ATP-binding cassette subfamily F protein 3